MGKTDRTGSETQAQEVSPGLRRLLAPNPSPMTFHGTNTYIIGNRRLVIIDPGPAIPDHLDALLSAIGGARVEAIFVTHSHLDHSAASTALSKNTGAPVFAYGDSTAGQSAHMSALAEQGLIGGGEGVEHGFAPDIEVTDGQVIHAGETTFEVLWTPGHFGNHICIAMDDIVFTGDHIMGWASSLISPPDGDLGAYLSSCEKLRRLHASAFFPGHGPEIDTPGDRIEELVKHRNERSKAILDALETRPMTTAELTTRIYTETPAKLMPAARRNVLAHLIELRRTGQVSTKGPIAADAVFHRS